MWHNNPQFTEALEILQEFQSVVAEDIEALMKVQMAMKTMSDLQRHCDTLQYLLYISLMANGGVTVSRKLVERLADQEDFNVAIDHKKNGDVELQARHENYFPELASQSPPQ